MCSNNNFNYDIYNDLLLHNICKYIDHRVDYILNECLLF